jgi:hypothetical protein
MFKIHFSAGWVGIFLGYCILNLADVLEVTAWALLKKIDI